ncbi:MAG: DNA primase [Gammaproteobacteria bacterium]
MNATGLLERLESVRKTGESRWIARCPAHPDKTPSLAVRELSDGTILLHCFAECSAAEIVSAVGLTLGDLFPARNLPDGKHSAAGQRRPFDSETTLKLVAREALVCALAASDAAAGKTLTEVDAQRCAFAAGRIFAALDAAGIRQERVKPVLT